jgi:hypothetical protein
VRAKSYRCLELLKRAELGRFGHSRHCLQIDVAAAGILEAMFAREEGRHFAGMTAQDLEIRKRSEM